MLEFVLGPTIRIPVVPLSEQSQSIRMRNHKSLNQRFGRQKGMGMSTSSRYSRPDLCQITPSALDDRNFFLDHNPLPVQSRILLHTGNHPKNMGAVWEYPASVTKSRVSTALWCNGKDGDTA